MKLTSLIFFFLLITTDAIAKKLFDAKFFELKNGLKVIVIENKKSTRCSSNDLVQLWFGS